MTKTIFPTFLLGLAIFLSSCGDDIQSQTYRLPKRPDSTATQAHNKDNKSTNPHAGHNHPEFLWDKPENWREGQGNSMRIATFKADINGETADCSILKLGGDGGGLASNINRWRQQVGLKELGEEQISSSAQIFTAHDKEFLFYHIVNEAQQENAFLTAIYFLEGRALFVKMSASKVATDKLKNEFITFCKSIREFQHGNAQPEKAPKSQPTTPTVSSGPHAGHNHPEFTWKAPNGWLDGPAKSMRIGTLIATVDGEKADCSISRFGGKAGGLTGNINRWRQQLGLPAESQEAIEKSAERLNSPAGEFLFYHIINEEKPQQAFLTAIYFLEGRTLFVKLSASKTATDKLKNDFITLCKTVSEFQH